MLKYTLLAFITASLGLSSPAWLRADEKTTSETPAAEAPVIGGDEWAKGITIHTSWDDAIKECRSTGKLLFIYNGWQREKV